MAGLYSSVHALPFIPDNLTVAQFMLDSQHEIQPTRQPDQPCLVDDQTCKAIGIEELRNMTRSLANVLSSRYQSKLSAKIPLDYPVALWAVHRLGGIVTCSNPQFKADELAYQISAANVGLVIVHSTLLETVISATYLTGLPVDRIIVLDPPPASYGHKIFDISTLLTLGESQPFPHRERILRSGEGRKKIALLAWSSGTTGNPKAVAISHTALIANILQMATHNQVDKDRWQHASHRRGFHPGDVTLAVLPFYHVAGLVLSLHFSLFCAMSVVIVQKYDFLGMLKSIQLHGVTHLIIVPPQGLTLCKHPAVKDYDLTGIKYILLGAAPVPQEIQEQLCHTFPQAQIGQAYGLTEMTATLSMLPVTQEQGMLGSAGRLLPGIQARVVKADGTAAGYGEPGELVVRGESMALGYFNDQKASRETFKDGWLYTGDEVVISRSRDVFVFDRLKEMIKVNGYQVAPAELEGCLLAHPDVADCCVVGLPDDIRGEVPLAYVVLSSRASKRITQNEGTLGAIIQGITHHVASHKAQYKHLRGGVRILDAIPRNGSGKLLRRVLRESAREPRISPKL
ncbi:acetyl-CoA synthetase-like protein [Pluteus cervinus]|uniref:Acetyl-CoA synthetase-like protein n=1 Tax=Pluteus cervinus TaxID=181527 RepID=A0ACD3AR82_9AGAR|nr:acetyl-CoA synthetase-like protein [Pluteus cervinus]